MKKQLNSTEKEIFNRLMSKQTKFTVNKVDFDKEKVITGTDKERERKCIKRAKQLASLIS